MKFIKVLFSLIAKILNMTWKLITASVRLVTPIARISFVPILKLFGWSIVGGVVAMILLYPTTLLPQSVIENVAVSSFFGLLTTSLVCLLPIYLTFLGIPTMLKSLKPTPRSNFSQFSVLARNSYQQKTLAQIDAMTGTEFEYYIAELLEKRGYKIEILGGSGDLGVDIIASKVDERIAVQCKRFATKVSRRAVSDVVAGMRHYNCNRATVITNNYFQKGAIDLAKSNNVHLVDRTLLKHWVS